MPKPVSFDALAPLPAQIVPAGERAAALQAVRDNIGDCTRCPLAYAGRRNIVFADGDPNARLMFVGEGPGADEDASGVPFVGKAGQLLNNMIAAMGLKREEVYIANIVKCRPPGNRTPEYVDCLLYTSWGFEAELRHHALQVLPRLALLAGIAQQESRMVRDRDLRSTRAVPCLLYTSRCV